MRSAYKKIFMPNDTESDGIENRLSEVVKRFFILFTVPDLTLNMYV